MRRTGELSALFSIACFSASKGANSRSLRISYLSKVHFIKNHLRRMGDAPEAGEEGKDGNNGYGKLVVPLGARL